MEIAIANQGPRFGRAISKKGAAPVEHRKQAYETVRGPLPWGIGAWIPLNIAEWTVTDDEIRLGPPFWWPRQKGRQQPIVDPDGGGIWYIEPPRLGRPLVYQAYRSSDFEQPKEIKYWVNEPLMFDKARGDLVVLSGKTLCRLKLDNARIDFWQKSGPHLNIQLSGVAQTAAPVPGTAFVFVVVRREQLLGFELVDLDRNLSLSRMVVLAQVPSDEFTWPNGDECWEELNGEEHCPVQLDIDEQTLLATLSYGGRKRFHIPLGVNDWLADIDRTLRWRATGELARELGLESGAGVGSTETIDFSADIDVCTDADLHQPQRWPKPTRIELEQIFPSDLPGCP